MINGIGENMYGFYEFATAVPKIEMAKK